MINQRILAISGGLIAAIVVHVIHNAAIALIITTSGWTLLVALFNYAVLAILMFVLWFVAGHVDRQRLRTYLSDEVPMVLSSEFYEALCKPHSKVLTTLGMTSKQRRIFIQVAAELAQKKLQLSKMGEEGGNSAEITKLREELRKLGSDFSQHRI